MKAPVKAVFFDIDGTMYYHGIHDFVSSTQKALWKLYEQGIKVGVATSRCHAEMANAPSFFRTFPFSGMVSDGGALVMEQGEIVKAQCLDSAIVEEIVDFAQTHHKTMRYSTIDGNFFMGEPLQKEKDGSFALYLNLPQMKPYEHDKILNLFVYVKEGRECDELLKRINGRLSLVNYRTAIECNPTDTDKSKGIRALADRWHLSMDEVMCFGDGKNDVKMIKACGIGVAMGNGCDEVKAAADFVTKRIEEDGIAYALEKYGLI